MALRLIAFALASLFLVAATAGCGNLRQPPTEVAAVTVTDRVDPHSKMPGAARSAFPPSTTEFFASARVLHAVKGTRVTAEWYYEGKMVSTSDVTFAKKGDRHVAFHLVTATEKPFPAGSYRVKVYLNDSMTHEIEFRVDEA